MDTPSNIEPRPATPRTKDARRAVVLGSAAVAVALLFGALGVVLMGLGQFPAVTLLLIAPLLGWWGKRRLQAKESEIQ